MNSVVPALLLAAAGAGACRTDGVPVPAAAPDLSGTYQVSICRGPCGLSPGDALLSEGFLVLEMRPYPLREVPQPARSYFARDELFLLLRGDERVDPNACFVLRRAPNVGTYAGISRVALTRWARTPDDSITLRLFQSPDAGYVARLALRGEELRGRGESWGVGYAAVSYPQDSIVARRIGPPDRTRCIRAGIDEARRRP